MVATPRIQPDPPDSKPGRLLFRNYLTVPYHEEIALREKREYLELLRTLAELPEKLWDAPAVAHALAARAALAQGNAVAFLRLHQSCPNMGAYLLDAVADAVRTDAAARVLRAFRPTVPPACLAAQHGFDDAAEARAFAARLAFVIDARGDCLVRESRCDTTKLDEKKQSSLL